MPYTKAWKHILIYLILNFIHIIHFILGKRLQHIFCLIILYVSRSQLNQTFYVETNNVQ